MNGYGTVEKVYRPLGIGIIKTKSGDFVIFTAPSVQRGSDGFQDLREQDEVHYETFKDSLGDMKIARDVYKKTSP